MTYDPQPIDTTGVKPVPEILQLIEILAKNAHDNWARQRFSEGWRYGPERADKAKLHPCLVPYADLPDSEKAYDRTMTMETIKAMIALGYRIEKPAGS